METWESRLVCADTGEFGPIYNDELYPLLFSLQTLEFNCLHPKGSNSSLKFTLFFNSSPGIAQIAFLEWGFGTVAIAMSQC